MIAFYIFGMSEFQDMLPVILETARRKHCWVSLFDCVYAKRQFEIYEREELIGFVRQILEINNIDNVELNFYGHEDAHQHEDDYASKKPSTIVLQSLRHKYPAWYPTAGQSNIVLLAWSTDSFHDIKQSCYHYKPCLVVLKSKKHEELYSRLNDSDMQIEYFGEIRKTALNFKPLYLTAPDLSKIQKRTCLISETWVPHGGANPASRTKDEIECNVLPQSTANLETTAILTDRIFALLRSHDFYIIWKKREKGQPPKKRGKKPWRSPIEITKLKPDFMIDRDLNFPTSLISVANKVDLALVINLSNAYEDMLGVNRNTFMFDAAEDHDTIIQRLEVILKNTGNNEPGLLIVNTSDATLQKLVDRVIAL